MGCDDFLVCFDDLLVSCVLWVVMTFWLVVINFCWFVMNFWWVVMNFGEFQGWKIELQSSKLDDRAPFIIYFLSIRPIVKPNYSYIVIISGLALIGHPGSWA